VGQNGSAARRARRWLVSWNAWAADPVKRRPGANGDYARAFNRRHARRGHLFGQRFSSWVVEGEEYLENTIRYVLLNPVRAGLCRHPNEWRWSASAL